MPALLRNATLFFLAGGGKRPLDARYLLLLFSCPVTIFGAFGKKSLTHVRTAVGTAAAAIVVTVTVILSTADRFQHVVHVRDVAQAPVDPRVYRGSVPFDDRASPELGQATIVDRFQLRPVLDLDPQKALQAQGGQLEGPPPPAAHQGGLVEFVGNNGAFFVVPIQIEDLRPTPGELSLFQRYLDPFPPAVGITEVPREDGGKGHPRRPDSDSHKELLGEGRERVVIGAKAPVDAEAPPGYSGWIGQDLDRFGKIEEARQEPALLRLAVDNEQDSIDSSLRRKFREGSPDLLHVFDGVEVSGMGPKDKHRSSVVVVVVAARTAAELGPNIDRALGFIDAVVVVAIENNPRQ